MVKLRERRITKRTVDGLSVEDKDVVFWDRELAGFGSVSTCRAPRFMSCRPTSPANRKGSWLAATA